MTPNSRSGTAPGQIIESRGLLSGFADAALRGLAPLAVGALGLAASITPAQAVPSYARQTGFACSMCHTSIPELTAFGRNFKLNGYVQKADGAPALPVTALVIGGFTHTAKAQDAPPLAYSTKTNDITSIDQVSLLYAGRITGNMGAFVQVTYDPNAHSWAWDNMDIRYADTGKLFGQDATYGFSLNNNPTVQDLWATSPAWGYPAFDSAVGPQSGPVGTLLQGTLGQEVLGLTGYSMFGNGLYTEFGGYTGLPDHTAAALGVPNASGSFKVQGIAPYARIAYSKDLSKKSTLMVGAMAMVANLTPWDTSAGTGKDHYVDFGIDSQYDYSGKNFGLMFKARDIMEWQTTSGAAPISGASNASNTLNALDLSVTYYKPTWAVIGAFSNVSGSKDAGLYSGSSATNSPNSQSVSLEVNYSPWMDGGPKFDPMGNMKIGAKYTHFLSLGGGTTNFDGAGHNASDNDYLFLYTVFAF